MAEGKSVDCTIHLFSLKPGWTPQDVLSLLEKEAAGFSILIKGRPHGWVHCPHVHNVEELMAHEWHIFVLARFSLLPDLRNLEAMATIISIAVSIPDAQYEELVSRSDTVPKANEGTPPLPDAWLRAGGVPREAVLERNKDGALEPGELRLDPLMTDFLSNTLPAEVKNKPVSLMNLFRYPRGDSSVHDHYMEGFKEKFGDAAGARVKFMGPVRSHVEYVSTEPDAEARRKGSISATEVVWQDANLVQYDTIWHYAYMLSTDIYQELNKEKVAGLEDTCILLVSEVELIR